MDNTELIKDIRSETDASLKEAKEVVEIMTEEDLSNVEKYGIDEVKFLIDIVRVDDLRDRLTTALEQFPEWWRIDRLAKVLGVRTRALRWFIRNYDWINGSPRIFEIDDHTTRDRVAAAEVIYPNMKTPRQFVGEVKEW